MIMINEDYSIDIDDSNYMVVSTEQKTRTDKTGKERLERTVYGYYTSLGNALEAVRELMVKDELKDGCLSLSEAVRAVCRVTKDFEQTIKQCMGDV